MSTATCQNQPESGTKTADARQDKSAPSIFIGPKLRRQMNKMPVARLPLDGGREVPLFELLEKLGGDLRGNLARSVDLLTCAESVSLPVAGVCGMMNTGKSTLVSYLLSEQGRARALVGIKPEDGTHRFVLWVPASWSKYPQKRKALDIMLDKVFDTPLEELSSDPEEAFAQYNARENRVRQLSIPLLAFDPALDDHGMALLDCPDIQREHGNDVRGEALHVRGEMLAKACKICSAFFLVSSHEQFEAAKLRKVIECIGGEHGGLSLFAVVTKVEQGQMESIGKQIEDRFRETKVLHRVRAAYVDPRYVGSSSDGCERYRLIEGEPADIGQVCHQLDQAELQRGYLAESRASVEKALTEARAALAEHERINRETTEKARATLLKFLDHHFNGKEKGLRPIYDKDLVPAMLESIDRTAPWYAWLSVKMAGMLRKTTEGIRAGGKKIIDVLQMWQGKTSKKRPEIDKLKHVDGNSLSMSLRDCPWMPPDTTDEQIKKVWRKSVKLMTQGGNVDEKALRADLDAVMREVWKTVSVWKKAAWVASAPFVLVAGLITVLLTPIDPTGTGLILSATVTELFAALGLGVIAAAGAGAKLNQVVEVHAARPQLSALFGFLQDHLGLPRAGEDQLGSMNENRGLRLVTSPKNRQGPIMKVLADPVFEFSETAMAVFEEQLRFPQ